MPSVETRLDISADFWSLLLRYTEDVNVMMWNFHILRVKNLVNDRNVKVISVFLPVIISKGNRDERENVDISVAKQDAQVIIKIVLKRYASYSLKSLYYALFVFCCRLYIKQGKINLAQMSLSSTPYCVLGAKLTSEQVCHGWNNRILLSSRSPF